MFAQLIFADFFWALNEAEAWNIYLHTYSFRTEQNSAYYLPGNNCFSQYVVM